MATDARRRAFIRAAALAAASLLMPRAARASAPGPPGVRQSTFRSTVIGTTQAGQPLTLYQVGRGPRRVLLIGGQHGGPELNTVELTRLLLSYFVEWPDELPPSVTVEVLMLANPDGLYLNSRQLLNGVDPNRNWGTPNWAPDSFDSDGQFQLGLGGSRPFSEPETRALAARVLRRPPVLVVNYHSAGGFVLGASAGVGGEVAEVYAEASGYWWPAPDVDPFAYPTTGTMDDWLGTIGVPNLFVELTDFEDVELERNLAGLLAALARLA